MNKLHSLDTGVIRFGPAASSGGPARTGPSRFSPPELASCQSGVHDHARGPFMQPAHTNSTRYGGTIMFFLAREVQASSIGLISDTRTHGNLTGSTRSNLSGTRKSGSSKPAYLPTVAGLEPGCQFEGTLYPHEAKHSARCIARHLTRFSGFSRTLRLPSPSSARFNASTAGNPSCRLASSLCFFHAT